MKTLRLALLLLAATAVPVAAQTNKPGTNNSRDTSACEGYTGESRKQCIEKIVNSAKPGEGNTVGGAATGGSRAPSAAEGIGSGGSQGPGVGATGSSSSGTSRPVPGLKAVASPVRT
jgi:hypothetical protein